MPGRKPVPQCTQSEWKDMTDKMRSCCPAPQGYSWRFMWSKKCFSEGSRGDCERRQPQGTQRGQILVRIGRGMSETETADILIHEVAHAYDMWTHHAWSGDHSATFWIWVGRVYRRYWGFETG